MALAMATTGIAANLLKLGRTFHSRLKAPLSPTENLMFNIKGQSTLAELIRMSKLRMIDEAIMLHRYQLEALDRTLRDIMADESGDVRLEEFDEWLLSLGDGTAPVVSGEDIIELPEDL